MSSGSSFLQVAVRGYHGCGFGSYSYSSLVRLKKAERFNCKNPITCSVSRPRRRRSWASTSCSASTSSTSTSTSHYEILRESRFKDIAALPEYRALTLFETFLEERCHPQHHDHPHQHDNRRRHSPFTPSYHPYHQHEMSREQIRCTIDAMLATFCLHVESRIAALLGLAYYTIGPCGEEALSSAAHCLDDPYDSVALHYRHLGMTLARQFLLRKQDYVPMMASSSSSSSAVLEEILLDRARGYTVSRYDPVTGGVHCSLGSGRGGSGAGAGGQSSRSCLGGDFIVTSTLASQCPPAVGRALGYALSPTLKSLNKNNKNRFRPVSFVTLGDGSVHNHHFWSAFHLARHARHRSIKCPLVVGISDNGLSISYETRGYVDTLFHNDRNKNKEDPYVRVFKTNGQDMMDVYSQTLAAVQHSRSTSGISVLHYKGLVRRFGHAATDRQSAYLTQDQIEAMADVNVLERNLIQAVQVHDAATYPELLTRFQEIRSLTRAAFGIASQEPKVNRRDMLERVSATMVHVPALPESILSSPTTASTTTTSSSSSSSPTSSSASTTTSSTASLGGGGKREVMRKHMTRVIAEALELDDRVVYLGEDVQHGGYYVVTEGLAKQFPGRVLDFPPDETSLLGAALGFAQCGLVPIVEIPYSKYLDCGADMFYEIAVLHWLNGGGGDPHKSHPTNNNGMIIRLQGFDRGLFGGNFHTTNMLQHMPPGVDVVCFSNGEDYVRGFRNALLQAKAGRVVMLVDCTSLLNLRHLHENSKDRAWERAYPPNNNNELGAGGGAVMRFDDVRRYGTLGSCAIIAYGNGVVTALQARRALKEAGVIATEDAIDVIDCPCLNRVPSGLCDVMGQYRGVVFADICKEGPGSSVLSSMVTSLQNEGVLPSTWKLVAAPRTYNPLGSMVTFLNVSDIVEATKTVLKQLHNNNQNHHHNNNSHESTSRSAAY